MPNYLQQDHFNKQDIGQFKADWKEGKRFFDSLDRSLRIHVECRQFYAMEKLSEIQGEQRFEQECDHKVNGVSLSKLEADFVSKNLGHGEDRWDVLNRYIGR